MKVKKVILSMLAIWMLMGVLVFPPTITNASETRNVVLVHGGWHGEWSWYNLIDELEDSGYSVTLVELPAHGNDTTSAWNASAESYVNKINSALQQNSGKSILVVHGSSSAFASRAAELNPNKVDKLLYISGVLVKNNECVASVLLKDSYSTALANAKINLLRGTMSIGPEIVYNTARKGDRMIGENLLGDEPLKAFMSGIELGNNFNSIPKYYIQTVQDMSLSFQYQSELLNKVPCNKVYQINSGHVPFITNVQEVVSIIDEISTKTETGIIPRGSRSVVEEEAKVYDDPEIEGLVQDELSGIDEVSLEEYMRIYDSFAEDED